MKIIFSKLLCVLLMLVLLLGVMLVLYLSWVSSPKIGGLIFIPSWMANWVDTYSFNAMRTAIPLIGLGSLAGLFLNHQKRPVFWWFYAWIILSFFVSLAELGQYFRPMRIFDWRDITWGSVGAAFGLVMIYVIILILGFIKNKSK